MRYIEKREEPDSLTRYKQNANAYFDGYGQKDDIRKKLLQEQGCLCGYCMRRISDYSKVKIEHIVPQSRLKDNEREALNYKSMLGLNRLKVCFLDFSLYIPSNFFLKL